MDGCTMTELSDTVHEINSLRNNRAIVQLSVQVRLLPGQGQTVLTSRDHELLFKFRLVNATTPSI